MSADVFMVSASVVAAVLLMSFRLPAAAQTRA
jgi:hypothetical protein